MMYFLKSMTKITALLIVVVLFSNSAWPANKTLSGGDPQTFSEHQITQAITGFDINKKREQLKRISGTALIDAIDLIKDNSQLTQLQKEFLLLQSVIRLRTLLLEDGNQVAAQREAYLMQLQSLTTTNSVTHRQLNDGGHYQIVKAFPFDAAAKSSIKAVRDRQKSNRLWQLLDSYQYHQLASELPLEKNIR